MQALNAALDLAYGTLRNPRLGDLESSEGLRAGARIWSNKCAHCHGHSGLADTPTASLLVPRPRSFFSGFVKYKSTGLVQPPSREDLKRTIQQGIPTTSMAGFSSFPDTILDPITAYTRWLLIRNQALAGLQAQQMLDPPLDLPSAALSAREGLLANWANPKTIPVPQLGRSNPAAVARGKQLFHGARAACSSCHGKNGVGKGPAAWDPQQEVWLLKDLWDEEARPRDLSGPLLGGSDPLEVWRRIALGIPGTPMQSNLNRLDSVEIEDLVHFVLSLQTESQP